MFIHFLLGWSAQFAPLLASPKAISTVEVEILENPESQNETGRQIVREAFVPDRLKVEESPDPLTFLSNQTQRVRQQTQAAQSGMTQNRSGSSPQQETSEPRPTRERTKASVDPRTAGNLDAFTPKYNTTPRLQSRPRDLDSGLSTIGEALPQEVAIGSFTALNTDRYLYYSFFSRIEEMIRFRWESAVRSAIDFTPPDRLASNPSGLWSTHLLIKLKRNGEVDSAVVLKESGLRGFDRAAIDAFVQARIFPNPPEEMVESDGLIHLKYSFQVRYEPKVLVKSRD